MGSNPLGTLQILNIQTGLSETRAKAPTFDAILTRLRDIQEIMDASDHLNLQ